MAARQLTSFEHIVLGLVCMAPSSGYDLKRTFAATPMGVYQPSSGTLYPALHRLERHGLVEAQSRRSRATPGQSARGRRMYEPTEAGRAAHAQWLRAPVAPATVAADLGLHLMRFVLMEHQLPPAEVVTFLHGLAGALEAFTAQLEKYATATDFPDRHPRLALDHGLAVYQASLRWAEHTAASLSS